MWFYENERACWTDVFYRADAWPLLWWGGENMLGHHTCGRRLPRGICALNSPWFPLDSDGKKASSRGLEVKFLETRQPAQPSSANGGWIWDMSRVKQHLQKSTVVQMQSKGVVTAGAQAGAGYDAAQLGAFTVRFADSVSPALATCDVCVDLGFVSPLLVLSFAPAPSGRRRPLLWCSSILHPLQWGCTKCFTISPTQTQSGTED